MRMARFISNMIRVGLAIAKGGCNTLYLLFEGERQLKKLFAREELTPFCLFVLRLFYAPGCMQNDVRRSRAPSPKHPGAGYRKCRIAEMLHLPRSRAVMVPECCSDGGSGHEIPKFSETQAASDSTSDQLL